MQNENPGQGAGNGENFSPPDSLSHKKPLWLKWLPATGKMRKFFLAPGLYWRDFLLRRYPLSPRHRKVVIRDKLDTPPFPIDIVYTWVNADDPAFQSALRSHLPAAAPPQHASHACRWESRDELKYSLRSVARHAPWINRIFIVTNGQALPPWLDTAHPKIRIIAHDDIIEQDYLPTFNSHVIGSCLHRIPGLSEHYIYLNDDIMFMRRVRPSEFFTGNGLAYANVSKTPLANGPGLPHETANIRAAKNARRLIFNNWQVYFDCRFGHDAHPQLKSVAAAAEEKYAAAYAAFRKNRFRADDDVLCCSYLHHCEGYLAGKVLFTGGRGWYIRIRDSRAPRQYREILAARAAGQSRISVCVNDHIPEGAALPDYEAHFRDFAEACFPEASPFERAVNRKAAYRRAS